jgi:hypothetical protein
VLATQREQFNAWFATDVCIVFACRWTQLLNGKWPVGLVTSLKRPAT